MPKRGGKRIRIKKLSYLIKRTIISNQDPFPLFVKLDKLLKPNSDNKNSKLIEYKLIKIDLPDQTYPETLEKSNSKL